MPVNGLLSDVDIVAVSGALGSVRNLTNVNGRYAIIYRWSLGRRHRIRETGVQFPIVVYPSEDAEGGAFTAHCLNMDVLADDDTVEGAVSKVLETIEVSLEAAEKHNANAFRDAPEEYWDKLASARPIARELWERILFFNANKRRAKDRKTLRIDAEKQLDLRQLETA